MRCSIVSKGNISFFQSFRGVEICIMADIQLPALCLGVPIDHRLEPFYVLDSQLLIDLAQEAMFEQSRIMATSLKLSRRYS
jgi:hypothetical protein